MIVHVVGVSGPFHGESESLWYVVKLGDERVEDEWEVLRSARTQNRAHEAASFIRANGGTWGCDIIARMTPSFWMFYPLTQEGSEFCDGLADASWYGRALPIDSRYIVDITLDARDEGLIVHPWDDFASLPWDVDEEQRGIETTRETEVCF